MFDEAFETALGGVKTVRRYGREIAGFADLAGSIAKLWTARIDAFSKEERAGSSKRRTRTKSLSGPRPAVRRGLPVLVCLTRYL